MPKTFNLLKNHFNFDGVFMVTAGDGKANMEYMDCPDEEKNADNVTKRIHNFTQDDLDNIVKYFEENKNTRVRGPVE